MKKTSSNGLYAAFDIGSHSVKAVIIEVSDGKKRLATLEERQLKPKSNFHGDDEYKAHIVENLIDISEALPLNECCEVTSLFANRELQVKIIDLPNQIQTEQLEKVLSWEAKKLLSPNYRDDPYTFSYRIVKTSPYVVCLSVIPQHLLTNYIELFNEAGIQLDSIFGDVSSGFSLKNIIDLTGLPALSIVNFGENGTHLQIFSSGDPKFYRFIPSGASEFSETPSNSDFEIYTQKIRFSFDYFRAISKLNQVDSLHFMGGGAVTPEFLPFARNYFGPTKVGIVDISSGLDITPVLSDITASLPPEERQKKILPYLPAVGAALSCFDAFADQMSLYGQLKKSLREEKLEQLSKKVPLWILAIGLIMVFSGIFYARSVKNRVLEKLLRDAETTKNLVKASEIKLQKLQGNANHGFHLSSAAKKAVEPLLRDHFMPDEILLNIARCRLPGLSVKEVLIRTRDEADSINFSDKKQKVVIAPAQDSGQESGEAFWASEEIGQSGAKEKKVSYVSSLSSTSNQDSQITGGLDGRILIVFGRVKNHEILSQFTLSLESTGVVSRYKSIKTRKNSDDEFEFLLKGEMP